MKNKDMKDLLNNFNNKKINPTEALISEPRQKNNETSNGLSNIVKKRKKMEDTHTRRTFLVKNELLKELDSLADKIQNSGFKTEFINYVIAKGIKEIQELD